MAVGYSVTFPTPFTVTQTPFIGMDTVADAMGNDKPKFGTPVLRKVYGWRPRVVENRDGHTSRSVVDVDLAAPQFAVTLLDRFSIAGEEYETVGIRDNNTGFHGWKPGMVVELKRVTG